MGFNKMKNIPRWGFTGGMGIYKIVQKNGFDQTQDSVWWAIEDKIAGSRAQVIGGVFRDFIG